MLKQQVAVLSIRTAEKILREKLDDAAQRRLVERFIDEVDTPLMSRADLVAERYARALFLVAERRGEIFEALEDLQRLLALVRGDAARGGAYFGSPLVPLASASARCSASELAVARDAAGGELRGPAAAQEAAGAVPRRRWTSSRSRSGPGRACRRPRR